MTRIQWREVTANRVLTALQRRVSAIPDTVLWRLDTRNRARLSEYRGRHAGDMCVVVANGPSLLRTDMRQLADYTVFSMNRAYLLYDDWGFVPEYFVCVNELVLEQFAADISQLPQTKFLNFNRHRVFREDDTSGTSTTLFVKPSMRLKDRFSNNIVTPISTGGTVTFVTLQIAFFLGFRRVVIVGMDHRFSETGTPNKREVRTADVDTNHAHPGYFPKGSLWQLPDLRRSELAYAIARSAYEAVGGQVIDATVGGACKVFQRRDLEATLNDWR